MNGRERALKALRREPVDRVPIYSHFRNPQAIEIVTGMDFAADPFAATAAAYRELGIDMSKEISVPFTDAPDGFVVNSTRYGINRFKPVVSTLEEFAEYTKSLPSYEQMKLDHDFDSNVREMREWFDKQQRAVGDSTLITGQIGGCFDPNLELFGYETFLMALLMEPDAAETAIQYHAALRRFHAETFILAGSSDVVMYCDDIAGLNGLLAPPEIMREKWLPHVRWALEPLMNAGIFVIYHSDGDIRPMLGDIADSGFRGLHPLEPRSNMDAVVIARDWKDRFILFGGLCQVSILPFGTEEKVREEVRRLLDGAAPGGGYFIGSSGMTGPDIPPENAIGWIEEAKKYGEKFGNT